MAITSSFAAPFFGPDAAWGWRPPFFAREVAGEAAEDGDYPDVYALVRDLVGRTEAQLPDSHALLVALTATTVDKILAEIECLGGVYADLSAADKQIFDLMAALMVADPLKPVLDAAANGGKGLVIEKAVGPIRTKYAQAQQRQQGEPSAWLVQAAALANQFACVRAGLAAAATATRTPRVLMSGRRRALRATCGVAGAAASSGARTYAPYGYSDVLGWLIDVA